MKEQKVKITSVTDLINDTVSLFIENGYEGIELGTVKLDNGEFGQFHIFELSVGELIKYAKQYGYTEQNGDEVK